MKINMLKQFRIHQDFFSRIVFLVALLLFLSGCSRELPYVQRVRPLPAEQICRVAVLPFVSESDYPLAGTIAYKVFLTELNALGDFAVTQEGDINKLYQQLRIPFGQPPTEGQLKILADRLNVQLLFTGTVIKMRENQGQNRSVNPELAMRIDVLDGGTTDILLSIYHHRQGMDYQKTMHFGIINSIAGLCQQVTLEIINLINKQGLTQCDVSLQF